MAARDIELVLAEHRYRAPAFQGIVEYEFCPVYVARAASEPRPNPAEVGCLRVDGLGGVRPPGAATSTTTRTPGGARTSCASCVATR